MSYATFFLSLFICDGDILPAPKKSTLNNLRTPLWYVPKGRPSPKFQRSGPTDTLVIEAFFDYITQVEHI